MRLLTGILTVVAAGIAASFLLQDKSTKSRAKSRFSKDGNRIKADVEKTINEGIYNLLDVLGQLISDYSKRSQKSIKEAKKKKQYVSF